MAISSNSYGSVEEVAALTRRYTDNGSYTTSTRPTEAEVEKFIDRVSAMLNMILVKYDFTIPVSAETPKLVLDEFAVDQAVQLCHAANGAGPYAPGSEELRNFQRSPFEIIRREAEKFISDQVNAFETLGATRNRGNTFGLNYRSTDDSGDSIEPMFQRKQFGNEIIDWDTDD